MLSSLCEAGVSDFLEDGKEPGGGYSPLGPQTAFPRSLCRSLDTIIQSYNNSLWIYSSVKDRWQCERVIGVDSLPYISHPIAFIPSSNEAIWGAGFALRRYLRRHLPRPLPHSQPLRHQPQQTRRQPLTGPSQYQMQNFSQCINYAHMDISKCQVYMDLRSCQSQYGVQ